MVALSRRSRSPRARRPWRSTADRCGWWAMRARAALALAVALALVASGCGGSGTRPFRIGILSDCFGPFDGAHESNLADAEVPLIELGAKPYGRKPSSGITPVDVAGRRVELLVGCVAGSEDAIPEARRLVEEDGARARSPTGRRRGGAGSADGASRAAVASGSGGAARARRRGRPRLRVGATGPAPGGAARIEPAGGEGFRRRPRA